MSCVTCGSKKSFTVNIVKGIAHAVFHDNEELFQQRIKVCRTVENGSPCKAYGRGLNCDECRCILNFKLRVKEESCPKKHWLPVV